MATAVDIFHHLHCSICKNLLQDPVTTSCGHTFCQCCLDQHMSMHELQCPQCEEPMSTKPRVNAMLEALLQEFQKAQLPDLSLYTGGRGDIPCNICDENLTFRAVKSCLTCLLSYCKHHLRQHKSLERLRDHKLVSPMQKLNDRACRVHGRPLELYCCRDNRCICALCVMTAGDVIPVQTERQRRQAKHQNTIQGLESMINHKEVKLEELQNTVTNYQAQINREEKEIKKVFAAVMDTVRRAEQELLVPLQDGKRCLETEMEEKTQQILKDILKYKEIIAYLEHTKNDEDDIHFLQFYPFVPTEFKHDWTVSLDTEINFGTMRKIKATVLDHIKMQLEDLCPVEIRRIQKFLVDVVLDAETADSCLQLSHDGKTVKDRGDIPGRPKQLNQACGVLGQFQIMSGRAFWVVEVGQNVDWEMGVIRENANRKNKISNKPSDGFWAIVFYGQDMYGASENPPVQLHLSTKPNKVGVFVDYEEALVSFYDMNALSHIYTFTECSFSVAIRPYFNLYSNKDGKNSSLMVISSGLSTDIHL